MIIIKVGGGKNINWDYIAKDLSSLKEPFIIVHGANALMKEYSEKLGITEKIIESPSGHTSRYTDQETMDLLTMVYSGLVNKKIVAYLKRYGVNAVGLSGADGQLWQGKRKEAILAKMGSKTKLITDSMTGKVEKVNSKLINILIKEGFTPVVTIPAITDDGELINVDNDRAVSVMARDLKVATLVVLFEAPGYMENINDPDSKVKRIDIKDLNSFMEKTGGRMKKKLLGVAEAVKSGVKKIYFADGRIENPVSSALAGKGTVID